ncbi:hypothetical protein HY857_00915 [Candidatus Saccharibacteria bacterium]|nr:hypothetical protein [Candidatus Saccharibacteria bacterium]
MSNVDIAADEGIIEKSISNGRHRFANNLGNIIGLDDLVGLSEELSVRSSEDDDLKKKT